jgi:hypothetical protein
MTAAATVPFKSGKDSGPEEGVTQLAQPKRKGR